MASQIHRVGIIGANWSLKVHGSAWRLLPGVEVAAVCTAHRETAEAAAQQFGVPKAYWNVADLVADPDLDIIDVGSRPAFRYEMVLAALKAGKHVYNALPFATDVAKGRELLKAQQASGKVGVVDAQFRWVPAARHMKKLIDDGYLGRPMGFNMQLLLPMRNEGENKVYPHSVWPEQGVSPYKWLGDKTSGAGGWRNFSAHSVLLLSHLLGPVEEAVGTLATGLKDWQLPDGTRITPETEDLGSAVLKLRNGAIGNLQTGWAVPDAPWLRVDVWGDRGRLLLTDSSFGDGVSAKLYGGPAQIRADGQPTGGPIDIPSGLFEVPGMPFTQQTMPPYMGSMTALFNDMLRSIEEGREGSPSFAEAVQAQSVTEAVAQSMAQRRWMRVDEVV
jgi:predicted dehydrogenase